MELTEAKKLLTSDLDTAVIACLPMASSFGIEVSFRSEPGSEAVKLILYSNGEYTVGRSTTPSDRNFLQVADAYHRAAQFLQATKLERATVLEPEPYYTYVVAAHANNPTGPIIQAWVILARDKIEAVQHVYNESLGSFGIAREHYLVADSVSVAAEPGRSKQLHINTPQRLYI